MSARSCHARHGLATCSADDRRGIVAEPSLGSDARASFGIAVGEELAADLVERGMRRDIDLGRGDFSRHAPQLRGECIVLHQAAGSLGIAVGAELAERREVHARTHHVPGGRGRRQSARQNTHEQPVGEFRLAIRRRQVVAALT